MDSYDGSHASSVVSQITLGIGIFVSIIGCLTIVGIVHCKTGILAYSSIRAFHKHDDFDFQSLLGFCFQIWDFSSDCLLCYSVYDHWYQLNIINKSNASLEAILGLSLTFVAVPWVANLTFLRYCLMS